MIFGIDVSTSIVGVSSFSNDGVFVRADFCDLRKVEPDLFKKGKTVEPFFLNLFSELSLSGSLDPNDVIYVEDRLANFTVGKTMMQTLMKLAAFNTLVSWIAFGALNGAGPQRLNPPIMIHIHPSTVKSLMTKEGLVIPRGSDKKKLTLEYVCRREPKFPIILNRNGKPQPYCYDMADGYITGRAGYLKHHGQVDQRTSVEERDRRDLFKKGR